MKGTSHFHPGLLLGCQAAVLRTLVSRAYSRSGHRAIEEYLRMFEGGYVRL